MREKRKVCLLGATAVGKTSLVARYVRSIFSDAYRTTIGVTIEKKRIVWGAAELDLVIWDLSGEDEFQEVQLSYVGGANGLLVVIDGTRRDTADTSLRVHAAVSAIVPDAASVFVLNKSDLVATWELDQPCLTALEASGWPIVSTSARTGAGVEEAFGTLARAMMGERERTSRSA